MRCGASHEVTSTCGARDRLQTGPDPLGLQVHPQNSIVSEKRKIKLIHEGGYAAEVEVELIDDDTGWSPCLSVADARKLDAVRAALKGGRLSEAALFGQVIRVAAGVAWRMSVWATRQACKGWR